MSDHVHDQRFDGDSPYLVCECGERWDALTGRQLWQRGMSVPMTAPEPRVMPRDVLRRAMRKVDVDPFFPDQQTGDFDYEGFRKALIAAALAAVPSESVKCPYCGRDGGQEHMNRAHPNLPGSSVPSESAPELGGHRVDVGLPVWSEETRAVPSESDAGLDALRETADAVREHHNPNEWDSCVACRANWPCDAEMLAELVLTRADLRAARP